jgi:hypothetical protein
MFATRFVAAGLIAFTCSASAQMSGTYLINPLLPLTTNTFPTFNDATAALAAQGVGGPCEFFVYDDGGDYNENNTFSGPFTNNTAVLVMTSWTGTSAINRVTFRAAPGERPVIDATGRDMGVFWGGADYVTLHGFEIRNATFDGICMYADASHGVALDPIIDTCRIHHCNATAITIYGNVPQPTNTLVQNCTMWSCQLTGGGAFSTTARFGYISTRRTNGTRIVHNTFFADTLVNSASYCVIGSWCSSPAEAPFAEISNNIFVKLGSPAAPLMRFNTPAGSATPLPIISESNCFFDVSGGLFALHGTSAGTTAATLADWQLLGRDNLSLNADPLFRDLANNDFHLNSASPCIDASLVVSGVADDADGQSRLAQADIGADEYSAGDYSIVGSGCPGTGGTIAKLDLWSWPFLGNADFAIGFADTPPNSIVGLFGSLGVASVPLPIGAGCTAYLDPGSFLSLAATGTSASGSGAIVLPVPSNPVFAGFNIGYQGLVLDAGAPLGFTVTNGINTTFDF